MTIICWKVDTMHIKKYCDIYKKDLFGKVIPFWMNHSPDYEYGGYFTCLDKDGSVYDDKKYMWLQAREAWMFARLYNEYEPKREYLDLAKLGIDFIIKHGQDSKGRVYFSLTRDGRPYYYQRKPYAAVFYVLALIEYFKLTGQQEYLDQAAGLFRNILKWIEEPALLDRPVMNGNIPMSNLADIMVLSSMAIEFNCVDKQQMYVDIMKKTIDRAKRHYREEESIFVENIPLHGKPIENWPEMRWFNPGHSIEVAWFLLHMLDFIEDREAEEIAYKALKGSLEYGWDSEYGGLYYFLDIENKPTLQLESSMKLWWPHTESLYALVLAYTKTGDKLWLDWLNQMHVYTYSHFVDHEVGGWFGYCDRQGNLTHTCKGGNYKGFFHTPRALWQCYSKLNVLSVPKTNGKGENNEKQRD